MTRPMKPRTPVGPTSWHECADILKKLHKKTHAKKSSFGETMKRLVDILSKEKKS